MLVIIGSHALGAHGIPTNREKLDLDIIATFDDVQDHIRKIHKSKLLEARPFADGKKFLARTTNSIFEYEIAWPDSLAAEFVELAINDEKSIKVFRGEKIDMVFSSLDLLYVLKMSHRYLKDSPHFLKTMNDIHIMRKNGAKIRDEHREWFKKREDETYWYKHPKLKQMAKDNFFRKDEGVVYVYDHDSIHVEMARHHAGVPAYELYKADAQQVDCSKKKFFEVEEKIRLWGVLEEAQVLALERSQVPYKGKVEAKWSFDKALEKVCTSITSGWFREFGWENYYKIQEMYEPDYVERFWDGVSTGRVKLVNKEDAVM